MDTSNVKFQPRVDKEKKVSRLRAGQLPAWAGDAAPPDHESSEDEVHNVRSGARAPPKLRVGMAGSRGPAGRRPASPDQLDDRHMDEAEIVQLSSSDLGSDNEGSDSDSSVPGDVVIVNAVDEPEVVDELQISSMRASIRDKLRAKSTATAAAPAADVGPALEAMPFDAAPKAVRRGLHSDEEASEDDIPGRRRRAGSDSSDDEFDSDDELDSDDEPEQLLMPVFTKKEHRGTIIELEKQQQEEERRAAERVKMLEQRKIESKHMVADIIRREEAEQKALAAEEDDERNKPDDSDKPDEFEMDMRAWAIRELHRLKAERKKHDDAEFELKETERRRNLTDEARLAEDRELEKLGLKVFRKEKKSMKFMQKYRHKGVFYMDEDSLKNKDDVRLRANNEATGVDEFDKSALPKPLQVRGDDFGKRGRTKWTHLTAEDTTFTSAGNGWTDKRNPFREKMETRLAGTGDINTAARVVRGKRKAEDE